MLAVVASHAPLGMEGELVSVEVDIRNGLPGVDIVGLPDGAVRESKDRVRVAIRNSGFAFPQERILVSLAPAAVRKEGASFDLPIALGVLAASGQITLDVAQRTMVLGELGLEGSVRPVNGVLSAVGTGLEAGIGTFLVPSANVREAMVLGKGRVAGIRTLKEAAGVLSGDPSAGTPPRPREDLPSDASVLSGGLGDIRGLTDMKRALEIAAAGRHHLLLFGPPGAGKTMSARALPSLLPRLSREEALAVTRIHSIAGVLPQDSGLVEAPPFRMPHHSASTEGILGGGRLTRPGEASLAHNGVLFLDEAPEFAMSTLQALREPVEDGWVSIARAGLTVRYPASLQLVLAFNPCPCGNLGRPSHVCVCSVQEIQRYWRRVGGALLDRIDIRIPVTPVPAGEMCRPADPLEGAAACARVLKAVERQRRRFRGLPFARNSRIPPGLIERFCPLNAECRTEMTRAAEKGYISSRAFHAILRIARTIADISGTENIERDHIMEAVRHRSFGDGDFFWSRPSR